MASPSNGERQPKHRFTKFYKYKTYVLKTDIKLVNLDSTQPTQTQYLLYSS
jgi:hypothetical protein